MRVITIGRDTDNNVVICNKTVSRHHAQIIQHNDGRFSILDMNSKNGTFVNGLPITREVPLKRGDTVRIGTTNLQWEHYFETKPSLHNNNDNTLALVLGSIGGALMLLATIVLFMRFLNTEKSFPFEGIYPHAVEVQMISDEGIPYTIEAIEGHVCVWFEEGTSHKEAEKSIKKLEGQIVAQIPENGYYLVKVSSNNVQSFMRNIVKHQKVERAYPNMVYYSCEANNYILDNYYPKEKDPISHGEKVEFALTECGTQSSLRSFNIGTNDGNSMCTGQRLNYDGYTCDNSEYFALDSIARLPNDGPIVINMSYGTPLPKRLNEQQKEVTYYWKDATDKEKSSYQFWYTQSIKEKIRHLKPLLDKDFIVVVAAGNEGVKEYDRAILSYLKGTTAPS